MSLKHLDFENKIAAKDFFEQLGVNFDSNHEAVITSNKANEITKALSNLDLQKNKDNVSLSITLDKKFTQNDLKKMQDFSKYARSLADNVRVKLKIKF